MSIGEIITNYCTEHSLSFRQFATKCGLTNGYISILISGSNPRNGNPVHPSLESYVKLAKGLSMDINELFDIMDDAPVKLSPRAASSNLIPVSQLPMRRVPVLGDIAAGLPITADRVYDEYVEVPEDGLHYDAAVRVCGDSMEPVYLNNDIVFIRYTDDVDDGQIAAVCLDDSVTLKHVYHMKNGVQLISENHKYPPMIYTADDIDNAHIIGVAVGFLRWYE